MAYTRARTADEQAFRKSELAMIDRYLDCTFDYIHFTAVPAGLAASLLFADPQNWLTKSACSLDVWLAKQIPQVGHLYHIVLFGGTVRSGYGDR